MAVSSVISSQIELDWKNQHPTYPRTDLREGEWIDGVNLNLTFLFKIEPCQTSKIVMQAMLGTAKKVVICPGKMPLKAPIPQVNRPPNVIPVGVRKDGASVPPLPDPASRILERNASADPLDPARATRSGGTAEDGSTKGIGGGSGVIIRYVAQDWSDATSAAPLDVSDEVLFHELVHALRQVRGDEDTVEIEPPFDVLKRANQAFKDQLTNSIVNNGPWPVPPKFLQQYDNYEEFIAVLITNIYRSENNRPGLVRDHRETGELPYPLCNARNFMRTYQNWITRMCNEMPSVCKELAAIPCSFNPIFELFAEKDWFLPGGRRVRPGAL